MQQLTDDFVVIEDLKKYDLTKDEKKLGEIMSRYSTEIANFVQMDDIQLEKCIVESAGFARGEENFDKYLSNVIYIKQLSFIEKRDYDDEEEIDLDIEILKDIKLEELVDITKINWNKGEFPYSEEIRQLYSQKVEEREKWNEDNICNTVALLHNIEHENIQFISNLSEYIDFIDKKLGNAVNYVSRGQKDCTFKLIPSLHRTYNKDYEIHSDNYESVFKQKIMYYDKDITNRSAAELRAEGQHFGLPTNYLDFTEAHLISLLFAIEEYDYTDQHSIVYFIDALSYNTKVVSQKYKLIDYSNEANTQSMGIYSSRSFFIKLGNSNERIHFQKGCFLKVSSNYTDEFDEMLNKYAKVVIINKECKKEILKELFNLGITFENIYPDKDNVVKSIKFHYEEMLGGDL